MLDGFMRIAVRQHDFPRATLAIMTTRLEVEVPLVTK